MLSQRVRAKLALAASQSLSAPIPPPTRRAVSGFPPHTDRVEGLPALERFQLQFLVEWVIETHIPGDFPVTEINCIGHADRDDLRGRAYELDISQRRGRAVLEALRSEIIRLTWNDAMRFFIPWVPGGGIFFKPPTVSARISFIFSGVGSKYAKPAINEAQRLRNRRVTMIFTRSRPQSPPLPPPPLPNLWLSTVDILKLLGDTFPGGPQSWRPPYTIDVDYPTKHEYVIWLKWLRKSPFRFFDPKPIVQSFTDAISPPKDQEEKYEKHIERATDAIIEEERERRKRTLDPPGDPDEPD